MNGLSVTVNIIELNPALIELHYLPPIAYFSALTGRREVIVEKFEHYEKQTYRNRCYILGSNGKEILILPLTSKHGKTVISEVKIDYSQKWMNNHWRAIQSAYGNAPFFEYYSDDLYTVLFRKHVFLYDLNLELLTLCLKWLKWNLPVRETVNYEKQAPELIDDLRSAITPKKTDQLHQFYQPAIYHQVFGNKFVNNLSLIDLVLCEGPGARSIVQASSPPNEQLQGSLRF
jgi:hypothetical protein